MSRIVNIKRVCNFYVSGIHLITMLLPYINKEIIKGVKFTNLLQYNLSKNVNQVLEGINLNQENKNRLLEINWNSINLLKYSSVEKAIKNDLKKYKKVNILITGDEKYIDIANRNVNKFIEKNSEKLRGKNITIISSYEMTQFNENIREILDKNDSILNTAGEHKIEEVFEDYKKIGR